MSDSKLGTTNESLRRQAKPLSDIKTIFEDNIPMDLIDIDNYRKSKSKKYLMSLSESIAQNGIFQDIGLIKKDDGRYQLAFGQCRLLACRDYLDEDIMRRAKVWPSSALVYIQTIALIENMDRQDTSLSDEIEGLNNVLNTEYKNFESPILGFCEQTGRNIDEIRNKLVIFKTATSNEKINKLLNDEFIKDYKSLYNLAKCLEGEKNNTRQKRVDDFINKIINNEVTGNMRQATEKLRQYAKGKIEASALPKSVISEKKEDTIKATPPHPSTPKTIVKKIISLDQIKSFRKKIEAIEKSNINEEVISELQELTTLVNKKITTLG